MQQLREGLYFLLACEKAWLFISYWWFWAWHCDVMQHRRFSCICYYYHFVFAIIIKSFWHWKFRCYVNKTLANDFSSVFKHWLFWMILKAEVKYKVIFQSKYEGKSSQNEENHVLSTGIRFFCFGGISGFSKEKN